MQSQNFEFLRPRWEELTELGALAETHAHVDPSSAAVKLRAFAEQVVLFILSPARHPQRAPDQPE
jgi:type I restriction enzyme, R subunit